MKISPKKMEAKIKEITTAWETLRPEKTFAGLTLAQFKDTVKASANTRTNIEALKDQLVAAQSLRADADALSHKTIQNVVNAVKGDTEESEDGELYEAMGYIRKSERKSGLSRGKKQTDTSKA